jgi:DNA-binding GntR family transcriptional regulator
MTDGPQTFPTAPGQPADSDTMAMAAAQRIRRRIETLALAPGATFTERELAEDLEIGKAPVREALLRLSGTGLITPRSGSGYVVAPLTLRHARSLFELWHILERGVLEALVERGPHPQFAEWDLASFEQLRGQPGIDDVDLQVTFHHFLGAFTMNEPLLRAFPMSELGRLLRFAASLGADVSCAADEHAALIKAVAARDLETAAPLAREHRASLESRVLTKLMTADTVQEVNLAADRRTTEPTA